MLQSPTLSRALRGETAQNDIVEIEPFGLPGHRRTILLRANALRNGKNKIIGAIVAQMDITHQKRLETTLLESEEKFRTITNAMPQIVWSARPDGHHDYYNQQWYNVTGVLESSIDAEGWTNLIHPEDQAPTLELWQHSLATGEPYEVQFRLRHRSGNFRWMLGRALPVRDDAGKITRWLGSTTDIEDQKRAEVELKESNKRKDEFLAMLAHELRNPLAPISTAAQLMRVENIDISRIRHASDIIVRQVKYMTDLVNDLLDVSRVTRGLTELEKEVVDLKSTVHSAIEQVRPLIEAKHHELRMRIKSTHAYVMGDKTRLVQVISNVLTNAAKYTSPGGEILLSLQVQGTHANVVVSDNGSGIAPSLQPYIFDLFTQAERTPDRQQGGLGLGLALVKSITNLHGGSVQVYSEGVGKGSTFTISLPLHNNEDPVGPESAQGHTLPQSVVPLRIMIVDDNLDAATALGALLEAQGHQVAVNADGESALKATEDGSVQVFILDIGMPGLDGFEVARRLRARQASAHAVLIALTGYGQAQDRALSEAAGFDYHCVKPVDRQMLASILAQVR